MPGCAVAGTSHSGPLWPAEIFQGCVSSLGRARVAQGRGGWGAESGVWKGTRHGGTQGSAVGRGTGVSGGFQDARPGGSEGRAGTGPSFLPGDVRAHDFQVAGSCADVRENGGQRPWSLAHPRSGLLGLTGWQGSPGRSGGRAGPEPGKLGRRVQGTPGRAFPSSRAAVSPQRRPCPPRPAASPHTRRTASLPSL